MTDMKDEPEGDLIEDGLRFGDRLRSYLESGDAEGLERLLEPLSLSDTLREVLELGIEERSELLSLLPPEVAAEIVEEAPSETAVSLVGDLDSLKAVQIIEELTSDIQADLIGEMNEEDAEAILSEMDRKDARELRKLAAYDDDTAGGIMQAEAFTFSKSDTVGQVLKRLAADDEDDEFERYRSQHPYVLDSRKRPVGVVSLRNLLTAKRRQPLTDIMVKPMTVSVDTPLERLRDIFDDNAFLGLPVVDEKGRLAGVVSRYALDEAVLERAEFDALKTQGVLGDELRSMPLSTRYRRRLMWLSANIGLNIVAAAVISAYESTLAAVIAIAVFLPMVSDMSGCSGNQAVAVTMRELSLGLVRPSDVVRVWLKEISVGMINGFALGCLIGIVAWLWKGNPMLGAVIGVALCINTVIAVSIGGTVPLLLKRFDQDPAVASGPLLTTITDMAGFFLVLSLATAFMPYLI